MVFTCTCDITDDKDHGYCDPEFQVPNCLDFRPVPVADSGCNYFASCGIQGPRVERCPTYTYFDPKLRMCREDYECEAPCKPFPSEGFMEPDLHIPPCSFVNEYLPIPGSHCKKYVRCLTGERIILECPDLTWFDAKQAACSADVKCRDVICVPKDSLYHGRRTSITYDFGVQPGYRKQLVVIVDCTESTGVSTYPIIEGNCTDYISCFLEFGKWTGEIVRCEGHSLYDPDMKECSNTYICPNQGFPVYNDTNQNRTGIHVFSKQRRDIELQWDEFRDEESKELDDYNEETDETNIERDKDNLDDSQGDMTSMEPTDINNERTTEPTDDNNKPTREPPNVPDAANEPNMEPSDNDPATSSTIEEPPNQT